MASRKKDIILNTARELFWKHGFKRVTVEEICEKAGISKMTFYKSFPDKISAAKAVFEREAETGMAKFRQILTDNSTPSEKMGKILSMKSESTDNISREFINDFYSSEKTELVGFVQDLTKRIWREAIGDFRKAQEKGVFRKDFKPEFLFILSQRMAGIISDPELLGLYSSPRDLVTELSRFFCFGIAPHDEK